MPVALPASLNSSRILASSIARRMAAMLLAIGVRAPVSKSRTVLSDTLARLANSVCDHPNHARAARLCSGDMPKRYEKNLGASTKIVDVHRISLYCVHQQFLVNRASALPPISSSSDPKPRSGRPAVRRGGARQVLRTALAR
jgi:hypothetical protein